MTKNPGNPQDDIHEHGIMSRSRGNWRRRNSLPSNSDEIRARRPPRAAPLTTCQDNGLGRTHSARAYLGGFPTGFFLPFGDGPPVMLIYCEIFTLEISETIYNTP